MDIREISHKWYKSFDEKSMQFTIVITNEDDDDEEELKVPAKFEVCDTCNGRGTCVNPSIDRHGLTQEDFDEDPDFRENYFSGAYDVQCAHCRGLRVAPEPNYESMSEARKKIVEEYIADYFADQREQWNERERGY